MLKVTYASTEEKLNAFEVDYWKKVFNTNLIFGSEVEFETKDYDFSIRDVRENIQCSGSVAQYGNGIEEIKSDGSLHHGCEILTPPRRIYNFLQMYSGFNNLVEKLYDFEPVISPRAGWHNHCSLAYFGEHKTQEKNIPGIILKNLLTLIKISYPGLCWFTCTIPESGIYTRYNEFCQHDRLLKHLSTHSLANIKSNFGNTRYNCVNLNRLEVIRDEITKFHIEFRFPDGNLFPALMASFEILMKALILKAIELSRYGLISSDSTSVRELYRFRNTVYDDYDEYELDEDLDYDTYDEYTSSYDCTDRYRASAPLNDWQLNKVKNNAIDLVDLLEDEITKIDVNAFEMCKHFASTPVSLMFKESDTDDIQEINEDLADMIDKLYEGADFSMEEIEKVISLGQIKNVEDKEDWINRLGELVACEGNINDIIEKINKSRKLNFCKRLGYYFI